MFKFSVSIPYLVCRKLTWVGISIIDPFTVGSDCTISSTRQALYLELIIWVCHGVFAHCCIWFNIPHAFHPLNYVMPILFLDEKFHHCFFKRISIFPFVTYMILLISWRRYGILSLQINNTKTFFSSWVKTKLCLLILWCKQ